MVSDRKTEWFSVSAAVTYQQARVWRHEQSDWSNGRSPVFVLLERSKIKYTHNTHKWIKNLVKQIDGALFNTWKQKANSFNRFVVTLHNLIMKPKLSIVTKRLSWFWWCFQVINELDTRNQLHNSFNRLRLTTSQAIVVWQQFCDTQLWSHDEVFRNSSASGIWRMTLEMAGRAAMRGPFSLPLACPAAGPEYFFKEEPAGICRMLPLTS